MAQTTATRVCAATPDILDRAGKLLRAGEIVAFPTETVYGLGADARSDRAVARIYAAKGRPSFNPLIVHVGSLDAAEEIATFSDTARTLAALFWPGPLTMVLPRNDFSGISALASAGLPTVAVRVPAHPIARRLLEAAGVPLAAPSANKSGRLSPTTPAHVAAQFGAEVAMVLAGGRSEVGVESTILDLTGTGPVLLRAGAVTMDEIVPATGPVSSAGPAAIVTAPGMLDKHYAPEIRLRMNVRIASEGEAFLDFGEAAMTGSGAPARLNLSETGDLTEAAANLFAMLHELDRPQYAGIAVAPVPERGLGVAINDRLRRAAR